MRMTRRQLAGLLAALPAAARRTAARKPQGASPEPPAAQAPSAADTLRGSLAEVRKLAVPAETEPAFSFRAQ